MYSNIDTANWNNDDWIRATKKICDALQEANEAMNTGEIQNIQFHIETHDCYYSRAEPKIIDVHNIVDYGNFIEYGIITATTGNAQYSFFDARSGPKINLQWFTHRDDAMPAIDLVLAPHVNASDLSIVDALDSVHVDTGAGEEQELMDWYLNRVCGELYEDITVQEQVDLEDRHTCAELDAMEQLIEEFPTKVTRD